MWISHCLALQKEAREGERGWGGEEMTDTEQEWGEKREKGKGKERQKGVAMK